jgi:beta-N-acetylhexosaminidase
MDEMVAVASAVPPMSPEGHDRLTRAMATVMVEDDDGPDLAEALAKRDALLALV